MKKKIITMLAVLWSIATMAQPPLVYDVEHTGANSPVPLMPTVDELPSIVRLPNPFEFSDGSKVVTSFADWKDRRAEIKAEIEHYEIGVKPAAGDVSATFVGNTLTVTVNQNGKTLTLTSNLNIPAGDGPFPVCLGMGGAGFPGGTTGIITMSFTYSQICGSGSNYAKTANDPYFQMFPELYTAQVGDYSAWSWGVSRLIDGLEIVKDQAKVDMSRIGVIGCSYAGKMALFAGAFDERIALTVAQEPGGGGSASWRITEMLGHAEGIGNTNYNWFLPSFRTNFQGKVDKIPYDHHELMAMCVPRALIILGNDGIDWLGEEGGFTNSMAALEVYKKFGIEDRFGFDFSGGHDHCRAATSQSTAVQAFVDKFLRGNENVETKIRTAPAVGAQYNAPEVDPNPDLANRYKRWQFWLSDWATDLPARTDMKPEVSWMEAESETCAIIGGNIVITDDADASNGKYVTVKAGAASTTAPATSGVVSFPFTAEYNSEINFYFRVNCEAAEDAIWIKLDNGAFVAYDVIGTGGEYKWVKVAAIPVLFGTHKVSIGFAKEGIKLDRVNITNQSEEPEGMGGTETLCEAVVPKYVTFDFEEGNINAWNKWNGNNKAGMDVTQESVFCGDYALKIVATQPSAANQPWGVQLLSPSIPLTSGQKYDVSFWIRVVDGGGKARISTDQQAGLGPSYWPDFEVGEAWELVTFPDMLATTSAGKMNFDMAYILDKTYYIDNVVIDDISVEDPNNVLRNGTFKNQTNWAFQVYDGSAGTMTVEDNKAILTPTVLGPNVYNPQLVQKNIPLEQGRKYRLTFTAFADVEPEVVENGEVVQEGATRALQINVEQANDPWASYLPAAVEFELTAEPKAFMVEFEMTAASDPAVQLSFNVGQSLEPVTIGNVKLLDAECDSGENAIEETSKAASNLRVSVQSNSAIQADFVAAGSGVTELKLYSVTGALIESAQMQTVAGENYSYTFSQGYLPSGFYVVWVNSDGSIERAKVALK